MQRLTVHNIAGALACTVWPPASEAPLAGVSVDSRTIAPGELFAALKGPHFDGHHFIGAAAAQGAAAVLLEKERLEASKEALASAGIAAIIVPDVRAALQQLAAWRRSQFQGPVIAVTGSNGKTSTKDMVAAAISQRLKTHATLGNQNNELGLPLTILALSPEHEALIVELGMRGRGEIATLCRIARPTVGIVTNVGPVHLERLGSLDAIASAKSELVEALSESDVAVLNADDARVRVMADRTQARVWTFGLQPGADVWADEVTVHGTDSVHFRLHFQGEAQRIRLPVPGRHHVSNALAAAAAALACGCSLGEIEAGLAKLSLSSMRMQIDRLHPGVTVINDAYNASPASMRAALQTLSDSPGGRKLAVLGDMLELGNVAVAEHQAIGRECARLDLARLLTVGKLGEVIAQAARSAGLPAGRIATYATTHEAARDLRRHLEAGDVLLVKASRGLKFEEIIVALRNDAKISPWEKGGKPE